MVKMVFKMAPLLNQMDILVRAVRGTVAGVEWGMAKS
jgi:hypothetical protein